MLDSLRRNNKGLRDNVGDIGEVLPCGADSRDKETELRRGGVRVSDKKGNKGIDDVMARRLTVGALPERSASLEVVRASSERETWPFSGCMKQRKSCSSAAPSLRRRAFVW